MRHKAVAASPLTFDHGRGRELDLGEGDGFSPGPLMPPVAKSGVSELTFPRKGGRRKPAAIQLGQQLLALRRGKPSPMRGSAR